MTYRTDLPQSGWTILHFEDTGSTKSKCEMCGTHIRYEFTCQHNDVDELMKFGSECYKRLTGSNEAVRIQQAHTREERKKKQTMTPRWRKILGSHVCTINGFCCTIYTDESGIKIRIGLVGTPDSKAKEGRLTYRSIAEAKAKVHEVIEHRTKQRETK